MLYHPSYNHLHLIISQSLIIQGFPHQCTNSWSHGSHQVCMVKYIKFHLNFELWVCGVCIHVWVGEIVYSSYSSWFQDLQILACAGLEMWWLLNCSWNASANPWFRGLLLQMYTNICIWQLISLDSHFSCVEMWFCSHEYRRNHVSQM